MVRLLPVVMLFLLSTQLHAQGPSSAFWYGASKTIVKFDPVSDLPLSEIPFDMAFTARFYFTAAPDQLSAVYFCDGPVNGCATLLVFARLDSSPAPEGTDSYLSYYKHAIDICVPPLQPNHHYRLLFKLNPNKDRVKHMLDVFQLLYQGKDSAAMANYVAYKATLPSGSLLVFSNVKDYYTQNKKAVDAVFLQGKDDEDRLLALMQAQMLAVDFVQENDPDTGIPERRKLFASIVQVASLTTTTFSIESRAKLAVVADAGLIYAGFQEGFDAASAYVGVNISMRPFNDDIPFHNLVRSHLVKFYQRFTLNVGVTLNTLAKTGYRKDLFASNNVMVGVGFKLNHLLNINAGGLIYQQIDANPLKDASHAAVVPYAGISINLKISNALGSIAKIFTYGK